MFLKSRYNYQVKVPDLIIRWPYFVNCILLFFLTLLLFTLPLGIVADIDFFALLFASVVVKESFVLPVMGLDWE